MHQNRFLLGLRSRYSPRAPLQTSLGELTALPQTLWLDLRGPILIERGREGSGWEERALLLRKGKGEERGRKGGKEGRGRKGEGA